MKGADQASRPVEPRHKRKAPGRQWRDEAAYPYFGTDARQARRVTGNSRTTLNCALKELALFLLGLLSSQRAIDGIDGYGRHHAIAFAVRMQAVVGEIGLQGAGGINHGGKVIHVDISAL